MCVHVMAVCRLSARVCVCVLACLQLSPVSVLCAPVFWLAASDVRVVMICVAVDVWHASACTSPIGPGCLAKQASVGCNH